MVPRKSFQSEFTSSQIWFYLILGAWMISRKSFRSNLHQAKSGVISFRVGQWEDSGCVVPRKNFGPNLHQTKPGVFLFWEGGVGVSVNFHKQAIKCPNVLTNTLATRQVAPLIEAA